MIQEEIRGRKDVNPAQVVANMSDLTVGVRVISESIPVDGVDCNIHSEQSGRFYDLAQLWAKANSLNRLLLVCLSGGQVNQKRMILTTARFAVGSWTIEEYYEADQHDSLWRTVEPAFADLVARLAEETSDVTKTERERLVDLKYYSAGTCARFMFEYPVEVIKDIIGGLADSVGVADKQASEKGAYSLEQNHHIPSLVPDNTGRNLRVAGFVSRYVAQVCGSACQR